MSQLGSLSVELQFLGGFSLEDTSSYLLIFISITSFSFSIWKFNQDHLKAPWRLEILTKKPDVNYIWVWDSARSNLVFSLQ